MYVKPFLDIIEIYDESVSYATETSPLNAEGGTELKSGLGNGKFGVPRINGLMAPIWGETNAGKMLLTRSKKIIDWNIIKIIGSIPKFYSCWKTRA